VASICDGVFALGSAGLIDNRAVTTHWMDVPRLAERFQGRASCRQHLCKGWPGLYEGWLSVHAAGPAPSLIMSACFNASTGADKRHAKAAKPVLQLELAPAHAAGA
jgi:putative intracellular protease/amidase